MKQLSMLALCCTLALFAAAQPATAKQKTISVTGTAEAEIAPDEIYVQVDLREYDKKGVGKIGIETIKTAFIEACKSIGLADSNISVQAFGAEDASYWQLRRKRKKDPDLMAGISYVVKLGNTTTMDNLVDKLDDEATQKFFIARVDYSKRSELKKQLKINAIRAAKDKAVYLTDAINEHIGGAITISDGDDESSLFPSFNVYQRVSQVSNNSTSDNYNEGNVGFKKIKFQFHVTVEFALL